MHSFPQFTRSTLSGEFAWVRTIIFWEDFMVRGLFSGGKFSSGKIIIGGNCPVGHCLGTIFLGDNCQEKGAIIWGAITQWSTISGPIIQGEIYLGGNCPRTSQEHLFRRTSASGCFWFFFKLLQNTGEIIYEQVMNNQVISNSIEIYQFVSH